MSYNDYDSDDGDSNLEYSEDEYNSEDDEFLAFHDADIEAQVDKLEILSSYWWRVGIPVCFAIISTKNVYDPPHFQHLGSSELIATEARCELR